MPVPGGCGGSRIELLKAEQAELRRVLSSMAALARTASALAASVQQRLAEELEEQRRAAESDDCIEAALKWMGSTAAQLQVELLLPPDERRAVVCVPPDATVANLWTAVHEEGGPLPVHQELAVGGRRLRRAGWRLLRDTGLVRAGARITVSRRDLRARRVSICNDHVVELLDSGALRHFGDELSWSPAPEFNPGSVTSVHAGYGCTAAVVAGKVAMWGDGATARLQLPEGRSIVCFRPPEMASLNRGAYGRKAAIGCAVYADGHLLVWNSRDDLLEMPGSVQGRAAAADIMRNTGTVVVLTRDGAVWTVDADTPGTYAVSERADLGGKTALSVSAGHRHYAVLLDDGSVRCFGDNEFGQCDVRVGLRGVVSCECGATSTVVLLVDGSLRWYGDFVPNQDIRAAVGRSGCVDFDIRSASLAVVTADGRLHYQFDPPLPPTFA